MQQERSGKKDVCNVCVNVVISVQFAIVCQIRHPFKKRKKNCSNLYQCCNGRDQSA